MIDNGSAGILRLIGLLGLGVSICGWALAERSGRRKILVSLSAEVALLSALIYFIGVRRLRIREQAGSFRASHGYRAQQSVRKAEVSRCGPPIVIAVNWINLAAEAALFRLRRFRNQSTHAA